jgi:AmiR/NasT family two-component response regulator
MSDAQQQQGFRDALGTRDVIGQAEGILMERFQVSDEQAFAVLVHASQAENRKLRSAMSRRR